MKSKSANDVFQLPDIKAKNGVSARHDDEDIENFSPTGEGGSWQTTTMRLPLDKLNSTTTFNAGGHSSRGAPLSQRGVSPRDGLPQFQMGSTISPYESQTPRSSGVVNQNSRGSSASRARGAVSLSFPGPSDGSGAAGGSLEATNNGVAIAKPPRSKSAAKKSGSKRKAKIKATAQSSDPNGVGEFADWGFNANGGSGLNGSGEDGEPAYSDDEDFLPTPSQGGGGSMLPELSPRPLNHANSMLPALR